MYERSWPLWLIENLANGQIQRLYKIYKKNNQKKIKNRSFKNLGSLQLCCLVALLSHCILGQTFWFRTPEFSSEELCLDSMHLALYLASFAKRLLKPCPFILKIPNSLALFLSFFFFFFPPHALIRNSCLKKCTKDTKKKTLWSYCLIYPTQISYERESPY